MNESINDVLMNDFKLCVKSLKKSKKKCEKLQQENLQLKYRIDKALFELRKYKLVKKNNDDFVSLSAMYEFIIDNSIEILKGDNND